jgi:hypothetical protein
MLVRVPDFGVGYGHLFPASSVARQKFAAVAAAATDLDAQELTHMTASVSARAHRKTLEREALAARLQAISRTARVLAAEAPGLDRQFEVPNPPTDHALLTTGRKFARDAEPFSSEFVAQGMPACRPRQVARCVRTGADTKTRRPLDHLSAASMLFQSSSAERENGARTIICPDEGACRTGPRDLQSPAWRSGRYG